MKKELKKELEKAILRNKIDIIFMEKIQTRENLEHKMTVSQREKIKNSIIIFKANISEAETKLEILNEL